METFAEIPSAKLCSKCSVLQFDDSRFGCTLSRPNGEKILAIHKEQGQISRKIETPLDYSHHDRLPKLLELLKSADAGCDFCRALRHAIQKTELRGKKDGKIIISLKYLWNVDPESDHGLRALIADLSIETSDEQRRLLQTDYAGFLSNFNIPEAAVRMDTDGTVWQRADFTIFTIECGTGNCGDWLRLEPAARQDSLCLDNLDGLKQELETCTTTCDHPSESTFVPTRLLDLAAPDTTNGIRLIETKDHHLGEVVQYAALSYCWGPPEDAKTQFTSKRQTLTQRKRDIPFSSLSRVMQDAVTATRSLGLRYLWIDSTCIVQDDSQDWEKEAERMGDVYSSAFVTVVALASSSCHQGFLERSPPLSITFTSSIGESIQGTFQMRHVTFRGGREFLSVDWRAHELDQTFSNWTTRAWCTQEMELSSRLVYFGPNRVWFSCLEREVPEPFEGDVLRPESRLAADLLVKSREDMVWIYDDWLALLADFCGRKITKRTDRFPAISGLAKRIAETVGDIYIAGLWREDFPKGLLFHWMSEARSLEDHLALVAPSEDYLAPTWSPLVSTGHVEYRLLPDFVPECQLICAVSTPKSQLNVFGQISHAEISISGRTLALPCDLQKEPHRQRNFRNQWWIAELGAGCTISCRLDWESRLSNERLKGRVLLFLVASYQEKEEDMETYSGGNRDAAGILLDHTEEDKYYRIGWFQCTVANGGMQSLEHWEYRTVDIV